jgi:uncharacterized secreted protein with C-terminal beta-propeller domain
VHSFDISSPTAARYRVSCQVRGTALNQFSLSEDKGYLRIATTDAGGGSESFVTVLADTGQALAQVGQVGGLGHGERIQAVRFIGDVGYVVTFRQTDPLYTVNLSDPRRPHVAGELKLLGYSAYLHPVGPGLLLGVGQDATDQGSRQGSAVSLFDVSNPASPKLLQHRSLGKGSSPVEFDHHAFLWWAPTQLAVLPLQQYDVQFAGAVGLSIARDAISEVGRVSHPGTQVPIERSLVIGNELFTLSQQGVLSSDLHTLAQRTWVPFS